MIRTAPTQPHARRRHAPIRWIVILGVSVSHMFLWFVPASARLSVLWLLAIGLSGVCGWLVPRPRRWLVGLGSLVSVLSGLSIDGSRLWDKPGGWLWFVLAPLVSVAVLHIYLTLSAWAVPIPDPSMPSHRNALPSTRSLFWRRRIVALLIMLHALGLGLRWAYVDHPCSWFDLTRRMQGCGFAEALPAFSATTYEVQLAPSGRLAASAAAVDALPVPPRLSSPEFDAWQQRLMTQASTIALWDLQTGTLLRTLEQPSRALTITWSQNDRLVATGSYDQRVRVWRVEDGRLLATMQDAYGAALSADGLLLATINGSDQVRLWSLPDGSLVRTITVAHHVNHYDELRFSPDGTLLAVRDMAEVTLWRVSDGMVHHVLKTDQFPDTHNSSLNFSPDGHTLATTGRWLGEGGSGGAVLLWRVTDGTLLRALHVNQVLVEEPYPANIRSIAFSADGTRLVAGAHRWPDHPDAALIWRVADGVLLAHIEPVVTTDLIRFSADDTFLHLYAASPYDTVRSYTQRMAQTPIK